MVPKSRNFLSSRPTTGCSKCTITISVSGTIIAHSVSRFSEFHLAKSSSHVAIKLSSPRDSKMHTGVWMWHFCGRM